MENNTVPLYKYYYNRPDKNGCVMVKCTLLTREEYIRIVHIDPVTNTYLG